MSAVTALFVLERMNWRKPDEGIDGDDDSGQEALM